MLRLGGDRILPATSANRRERYFLAHRPCPQYYRWVCCAPVSRYYVYACELPCLYAITQVPTPAEYYYGLSREASNISDEAGLLYTLKNTRGKPRNVLRTTCKIENLTVDTDSVAGIAFRSVVFLPPPTRYWERRRRDKKVLLCNNVEKCTKQERNTEVVEKAATRRYEVSSIFRWREHHSSGCKRPYSHRK